MRVVWQIDAVDDRRRITAWLRRRNPGAAARLGEAMLAATDGLSARPSRGRPGSIAGTRELSPVRPYVILYKVDDEAGVILILRVWHTARDRDGGG